MKTKNVQIPVETIEFISVETTEPCAPRPVRTPRIIAIGAAAIMSVAALAASFPKSGNEPAQPAAPPVRLSEREQLEALVERGLVPRQALEPALSEREQLEALVERGLVPRLALEPVLSEREQLEALVDRGLVPRQALKPVLSEREQLEVLVERGLVPRQALEPAPLSMEQKLQDLVDRGLIPRQALEPTPATRVATIAGRAHPLGVTDVGVPCSSLVYTRC